MESTLGNITKEKFINIVSSLSKRRFHVIYFMGEKYNIPDEILHNENILFFDINLLFEADGFVGDLVFKVEKTTRIVRSLGYSSAIFYGDPKRKLPLPYSVRLLSLRVA